ncbi:MAG: hypothetical protein JSV86_01560 [Gemmatimonadota bacterium]|nr:MAG: hypothetical protein JSV86_01560 [Gemmatimonadota bacterium]
MLKHVRYTGLLILVLAATVPTEVAGQTAQAVDEIVQTSVALTGDEAILHVELASGRSLQIVLSDGQVLIDGDEAGRYAPGGALESAWRDLLREASLGELGSGWASFFGSEFGNTDAGATQAIRAVLVPLVAGISADAGAEAQAVAAAEIQEAATAQEAAETEAAAASVAAQVEALEGILLDEVIVGGLVVELTQVKGLARQLVRIGLAPELERLLNGDLEMPVRIVIDADEYRLPEGAALDEMLLLVESNGVVAGTIRSNVLVADGTLLILPTARIEGDVIAIDATVTNQGTVEGTIREPRHPAPVVVAPATPRVRMRQRAPSALSRVTSGLGSLAKTVAMYLLFAFMGALIVYFFRGQLETVSDTVSFSFGRSFLAGLAAEVLFLPIGLVMTVLVVTAIAVPFYVIGFGLLSLLGYTAVAHAAGENLTRRRFSWTDRMRRANSYYYVLNGLGVLLALFVGAAITHMAYPLLGWAHDLLIVSAWILTWIAATSGLGAALLSRAGTRRTYARPRELPELPADSLAEEMEPIERRAEARRRAERSDES